MCGKLSFHQFFVPYERNIKTKCEICTQQFSVMKREHVCKRCFRSVCADCSPFKVKCYRADYQHRLHRMCRVCHIESETLGKYVRSNRLKWAQDSDIARMWLKKLGLKTCPKRRHTEKGKQIDFIEFGNLWKSLNFSFREFIGIVIDEGQAKSEHIQSIINLGINELAYAKVRDLESATYILLFFLAHSNLTNAIFFTNTVMKIIEPEENNTENILHFLESMNCNDVQIYKMENIIEQILEKVVRRATINVFTAEISIEIVTYLLLKRDFEELQKGVSFVFNQRKEFICMNANKPEEVFLDILRNLTSSDYLKITKSFENKSQRSRSNEKSETLSKNLSYDQSKYQKLLKQRNQLFVKVQEQSHQIIRLKEENKRIKQKSINEELYEQIVKTTNPQENIIMRHEQSSESSYNQILLKKNQEIAVLKKQLGVVKDQLRSEQTQSEVVNEDQQKKQSQKQKELKAKEQHLQKLKKENEAVKNANKHLLIKLKQLSNKLMDKEQKQMSENDRIFDEELLKKFSNEKLSQKEDCIIF